MQKEDFIATQETPRKVREGLEKIFEWARDTETLPFPDITDITRKDLEEIEKIERDIEEIYDLIDEIIFGYEELVINRGDIVLAEKYPQSKVYHAGTVCYVALNSKRRPVERRMRWCTK